MHKSVEDCAAILVLMSKPTHYQQFIILLLIIIIHMTVYTSFSYWFKGKKEERKPKMTHSKKNH